MAHPNGWLRVRWDLIVAFGVIASVWLVPFTVAFQEEITATNSQSELHDISTGITAAFGPIERTLDVLFMVHVLIEFRTGYIDAENKELIVDAKKIAARYIRGWFLIDLLASLPFDLVIAS
eukprot:SAG11_NODE_21537_length_423_cov_0.953704_1_plen_120_part_10